MVPVLPARSRRLEQQQLQQALAPAQASSSSSTPTRTRSRTSSFTDQLDDVTPNRENASTQATKSPDGVSKDESSPSQSGDTQTFAQKLQLRVPSMESLFRSPIKESLFRSSKEPLVRTSSRESLNSLTWTVLLRPLTPLLIWRARLKTHHGTQTVSAESSCFSGCAEWSEA